jgi:hypothetical protein
VLLAVPARSLHAEFFLSIAPLDLAPRQRVRFGALARTVL